MRLLSMLIILEKNPLKGGVPYVFLRGTKQLAPMLPHPFLVSEYVKIFKMKDEVAAVKRACKNSSILLFSLCCGSV